VQSSRGVSIPYLVVLVIGFGPWIAHGLAAGSWALIVPNAVAAVVMCLTITVAFRFR